MCLAHTEEDFGVKAEAVKDAFFVGMEALWLEKKSPEDFQKSFDKKKDRIPLGNFALIDECRIVAGINCGISSILYCGHPLFRQHYFCWFQPEAFYFLQKCLAVNLVEKLSFFGGRGPAEMVDEEKDLIYQNLPKPNLTTLERAEGIEQITNRSGSLLGYMNYQSFLL